MVHKLYSSYEKANKSDKKNGKNIDLILDYLSLAIFMLALSILISIFIYLPAGNYTENPEIMFIGYLIGLIGGIVAHLLFPFDNIYAGLILMTIGIVITFLISFYFSIYPYYVVFKGSLFSLIKIYFLNHFYLKSLSPSIFIYFLTFNTGYYGLIILKK